MPATPDPPATTTAATAPGATTAAVPGAAADPVAGFRTQGVQLVRLAGALDGSRAAAIARELPRHVEAARALGQPLVLDLADVTLLGVPAAAALDAATRRAAGVTVAAAAPDPQIREALARTLLPGVRVHTTVAEALAALAPGAAPATHAEPQPQPQPEGTLAGLRAEIYGLRARARSHGLIDVAQGVVLARYGLPEPRAAFALLRQVSQAHNVPLRVLASAVVTAPPPPDAGPWFAGRRRVPPPAAPFLTARGCRPDERGKALQAAVDEAVERTGADAGALHLTDRAQGGALVLEAHRGLSATYCDAYAHVVSATSAVARACEGGLPVTDVESAPDPGGAPGPDATLPAGPHTVHAVPVAAPGVPCAGALSVQQAAPDAAPAPGVPAALQALAADVAVWLSWYHRAVLLDALELLHARAAATHGA
ncbi:ANTAR domain-containing protein [Actinacidiphila epipremni]|uniref:ANTAR domain-containing protein n=1 Tax=Actinacidiphila epipremni TaxID=2053013 RepID=A0ABX0ZU63_9ACTN|nr:ANTAR domain-containing protein [Actinacidiphila epipremni]NJP45834.1 ANTAR domain-containing protein [Actinacidiphila epipremni]